MGYTFNPFIGNFDNTGSGGSGGTPGGSDTQVQFNDGGAFGGDADFIYDKTTNTMRVNSIETNAISAFGDSQALDIVAADATTSGNTGGDINITTGAGLDAGDGGGVYFNGGVAGVTGAGGGVSLNAGNGGATSGAGGDVGIGAGTALGTDSDGGSIDIIAGNKTGTGTPGTINLRYDGSGGATNGDVWELQDATTGAGAWVTPSSGSGTVDSVVAGNNIDVDATDPANPVVSVESLTLSDIGDVTASATEVNYTDGVTSAIQTQLDTKTSKAFAIAMAVAL